jgi:hypothetical protein
VSGHIVKKQHYALLPEPSDCFQVGIAHGSNLKKPAVAPFLCVGLQLCVRSVWKFRLGPFETNLSHHGIFVLLGLLGDLGEGN